MNRDFAHKCSTRRLDLFEKFTLSYLVVTFTRKRVEEFKEHTLKFQVLPNDRTACEVSTDIIGEFFEDYI